MWIELTDAERGAIFAALPGGPTGFLKTWGWKHFAEAIEAKCREKNGPHTRLVDAMIRPSREDGGWGFGVPHMIFFAPEEGDEQWGGPNVKIENNSTRALRVVIYDHTEEWKAERASAAERAEREQLAALKAKYEAESC